MEVTSFNFETPFIAKGVSFFKKGGCKRIPLYQLSLTSVFNPYL